MLSRKGGVRQRQVQGVSQGALESWFGRRNGEETLEAKLSKMESDDLGICGCSVVVLVDGCLIEDFFRAGGKRRGWTFLEFLCRGAG